MEMETEEKGEKKIDVKTKLRIVENRVVIEVHLVGNGWLHHLS